MGISQGSTKKGVIYEKKTGEIIDCLFCRIARGESPENQLWYQDDRCVVFIPRGPVAQLHLLVVPLEHIQNIFTLTEKHQALLEHMQKVAIEQLRVHSQHYGSGKSQLIRLASPPSDYPFNRGNLPKLNPDPYTYNGETTQADTNFLLCFHRPPYNSIDHLHLHAIEKPYRSVRQQIMFLEYAPWHASLESVMQRLRGPKAHL